MRCILTAVAALLIAWSAGAQVYLTDVLTPTDSKRYEAVKSKGKTYMSLAVYPYKGGFTLSTGLGGLINASDPGGYAIFQLGGAYEKLSFVVGPGGKSAYEDFTWGSGAPNAAGDSNNVIMTVKADGRTLADDVIWCHDTPREYVLNVKGVNELRFSVLRGEQSLAFGEVRLWKAGQTVTPAPKPLANTLSANKVNLGKDLWPYYIRHSGWVSLVTQDKRWKFSQSTPSVSVNRKEFTSGLQFTADQALAGHNEAWAYFWLQKKFDKVSFIIGPRDNQSTRASGWITVKGDGKILYERLVVQDEIAEQVVLDVKGVNQLSFHSIDQASDFLGGLTFGVVDIYAYKAGVATPKAGVANLNLERISKLPDATMLVSNIKPFSVRGVGSYNNTYFDGESSHYTFSMGGEKFSEGFILTTGTTLFDDNISSYAAFDLAGQYDWATFTVGTLTNHRVLDEDRILVYADDKLVLEADVHCTWPNQVFTVPLGKCRILKFAKPGTGKSKQTYIGVGDVMVFRGEPQDTEPYFYHPLPELPETVDLIDLCERPYFHYVGRYLSSLTNFDFNDCFKNGSSQKEYFQMKDGSRIYKGIMLETNIPPALAFEDITLSEALFIFLTSAGSSISASNVSAATGISAGAGLAGALAGGWSALNLVSSDRQQSSAAAFNPYGAYQSITFTVANKSAYVEEPILGVRNDPENPVKLMVFADMRKVGEFWLGNSMPPTTFTLPINGCTQLMFWLECGPSRSGQYVLYDMTLSKEPLQDMGLPVAATTAAAAASTAATPQVQDLNLGGQRQDSEEVRPASLNSKSAAKKAKKEKKEKERVVWARPDRSSRVESIDILIRDVDEVWELTNDLMDRSVGVGYRVTQTYLQSRSGKYYKAVSLVDAANRRLNFREVMAFNKQCQDACTPIQLKIATAYIGVPSANVGILSLEGDRLTEFPRVVKLASKVLDQCGKDLKALTEAKEAENDGLQFLLDSAVDIGDIHSTDTVLLMTLSPGESVAPGTPTQMLEYYNMN